ncbi:MAG: mechanosensitive ion channel family protein [Deltaproteobacteria bacterium]|nr:mechanosensitive ion channel family protein [Deltaproteobacteria bacterium]
MEEIFDKVVNWWASPYVQAGAIVVGSFIAAKLLDWLLSTTITALTRKTKTRLDDKLVAQMHGPIVKTVVLVGLYFAITQRLGLDKKTTALIVKVLWTLGLVVWTFFSFKVCSVLVSSAADHTSRFKAFDDKTRTLFDNVGKVVIIAMAFYLIIAIWDFDATGWLASAGIAGIAVGFAAKDTLSNLFAGVFIIADASFKVGDFIVLDTGERGQVVHIGLRSTRILTRDDIEITVPNSVLGTTKITNEAGGPHPKHRVRVKVGVAYGSDIDKVKEVLMGVAEAEPLICQDPEPRVRFRNFGDSSLDVELLGWIEMPVQRGRALDALNTAVYKRFAEEGIQIPFPQRDIYLKEAPRENEAGE